MVSLSLYESVFHSSSIGSYLLSPSTDPVFLDVNDAFLKATSRTREELLGKRLFAEFGEDPSDPSGVKALRASIARAIATGKSDTLPAQRYPIKIISPDGEERYEERFWNAVNTPIFDQKGHLTCLLHHTVDITQQIKAEEQAQESAKRLKLATDAAKLGIWLWDFEADQGVWENDRLYEMFGVPRTAEPVNVARFVSEFIHPDDIVPYRQAIARTLETGERFRYAGRFYRQSDCALRWFEFTGLLHRNAEGKPCHVVGTAEDITDRKHAEEQVRRASLHDALTGLPNRVLLFEYASHVLPHNVRANRCAAVLYLDLDRFKPINDTHGHEMGDLVLKEVASRLAEGLRAEDIVTRLGGDEFVILIQQIKDSPAAAEIAGHVIERIGAPYEIGELKLSLSTSIGISMFPGDGCDIDTLISHADMAMYHAKRAGRNNFQFYSSEYSAGSRLQFAIEQELKAALSKNAFCLSYQPVVDVRSGAVIGVEALLRLPDSEFGPAQFVPVAETSGVINRIGRWLLEEASRQHRAWLDHGLPPIPIAINVSVVEFRNRDFANRFEQTLHEYGIGGDALQLEVTETAVMDDVEHAVETLTRLKRLGVKILLDDFGTGHSSLAYLVRLPLNKVKIDKSFVSLLDRDSAGRAVTNAMIALGQTLELDVVAEGVETEDVYEYIRSNGCTQAQGFFLAKPMSGSAFEHWYRQQAGTAGKGAALH